MFWFSQSCNKTKEQKYYKSKQSSKTLKFNKCHNYCKFMYCPHPSDKNINLPMHFIFMKECNLKMFPISLRYLSFTSFMRNLRNVHLKNSCIAPKKLRLQTIAKQNSTLWRVTDVFRQTSLTNVPNNDYETIIYCSKICSSFILNFEFRPQE